MRAKNIVLLLMVTIIGAASGALPASAFNLWDSASDIAKEANEKWQRLSAEESLADNFCSCVNDAAKKNVCVKIRISKSKTSLVDKNNACEDFGSKKDWMVLGGLLVQDSAWVIGTDVGKVGSIITGNMKDGEKLRNFNQCTIGGDTEENCKNRSEAISTQMGSIAAPPEPKAPQQPDLEMTIPGLELSKVAEVENGVLYLPWIAEYVASIFKYGITIASVLAVVLIILQGIKITISGGGEKKSEAYKTIVRVVIGLIIAWSSYAILYTINPNLVTLKTLPVEVVMPENPFDDIAGNGLDNGLAMPDDSATGTRQAVTKENGVALNSLGLRYIEIRQQEFPYVAKEVGEALKIVDQTVAKVEAEKKRKIKLQITSSGRSMASAQAIWEQALKNAGGDEKKAKAVAAKPSLDNSHVTGNAVDIIVMPANGRTLPPMGYNNPRAECYWDNNDVKLLSQIMTSAGWARYCPEWWHFEYPANVMAKYGWRTTGVGKCTPCN